MSESIAFSLVTEGTPSRCRGCATPVHIAVQLAKLVGKGRLARPDAATQLTDELDRHCQRGWSGQPACCFSSAQNCGHDGLPDIGLQFATDQEARS